MSEDITVPKTDSIPAWQAYNQLRALCQNENVAPKAIEEAIERVERVAIVYRTSSALKSKSCYSTGLELESVAKFYRWVHKHIHSFRSAKLREVPNGCTVVS
jgi:hypothetical protein